MMMKKLTNKQWQVFKYLAECSDENGNVQSSIRKVQKEFGYKSPNTIFKHILALQRKGWVKKTESGKIIIIPLYAHKTITFGNKVAVDISSE